MSLKIKFHKGLPSKIFFLDKEIGSFWGIETSDRLSFFTLTEKGQNYNIISDTTSKLSDNSYYRELEVKMGEGHWKLLITTKVYQNKFCMKTKLIALTNSIFQDFVHRYRFNQEAFNYGIINNNKILFTGSNIWYQYNIRSASLYNQSFISSIKTVDFTTNNYFTPEMYVRDEPSGYWIVHSRFIPKSPDLFWIKWDTRFGRIINIKGQLAKLFLSNKHIKKALWYRAEKVGGRPNIIALGLTKMKKGDEVELHTECSFDFIGENYI